MNRSTHQTRTNLTRSLSVLGLSLAVLAGCHGQGKYTAAGRPGAEERMSQLKSGVEFQTAERQFLSGDLPKALRTIERSLAINPKVAKSHALRGRILMELANYEPAREALLTAEELDATRAETQYFIGIIAERTSQFAEAQQRYTRAAQLDSSEPQYVIASGEMLIQLGKIEEADALLRDNLTRFPTTAALRHTLGQMEMMRSRHAEAAEWFGQARLLSPEDTVILEDLTRTLVALRRYSEADINLEVLLANSANANRTDLKMLKVRCLAAMDRLGDARGQLAELLNTPEMRNDVQAWILMGNLAARLDDIGRLRVAANRVIALAPDRPEGHALKAMLMRLMNRQADALSAVNTSLSINANDPELWVLRGIIQAETGQYADSRRSLLNAQRLDPTNRNAQTLIAVVNQLASPTQATAAAPTP
jgi:tetratricopeptide (TPR) repeat protein